MDPTTQAAVNSFFSSAPRGEVEVTLAGDAAMHRMPASMGEVASFVNWNTPASGMTMDALRVDQVIDMDPGINLGSVAPSASQSGPALHGTNYSAIKPKTPGLN